MTKNPVFVALDTPSLDRARTLAETLKPFVGGVKLGLEFYGANGPEGVRAIASVGAPVFLDLKLHDIPNTVFAAARSVSRHGASLLTIHASGGTEMIRAAVDGAVAGNAGSDACGILGVTILTSLDGEAVGRAWGRPPVQVEAEVLRLAALVRDGGGAGIVCSGHEAAAVRAAHGESLGLLIPGIRLPGGDAHDQRRVMTPVAAADAGARWVILGRAVTASADPAASMAAVRTLLAFEV